RRVSGLDRAPAAVNLETIVTLRVGPAFTLNVTLAGSPNQNRSRRRRTVVHRHRSREHNGIFKNQGSGGLGGGPSRTQSHHHDNQGKCSVLHDPSQALFPLCSRKPGGNPDETRDRGEKPMWGRLAT